jgi:hypothetical protein
MESVYKYVLKGDTDDSQFPTREITMPKTLSRTRNWVLGFQEKPSSIEHRDWRIICRNHIIGKKVRFIAYRCETCLETGDQIYQAYCVFPFQIPSGTVGILFPFCSRVPLEGGLVADPVYNSMRASLIKLGVASECIII